MATNVPEVTFGPAGFIVPDESAVLAGRQADINAAFGGGVNPALETPQGQLATSETAIIGNTNDAFLYLANGVDPAYASGRMQDAIGRIYFLSRNPSLPTVLQVICTGITGVTIPVGAEIQDTANNLYVCTGSGAIQVGGTVGLSFACTQPGPIAVPGFSDVSIYRAIPGWDSVAVSFGVVGVNVESRAEFERRRRDAVAANSFGAIGSIIGAVADVPDVIDYYGFNNNTSGDVTVGGVSIDAHAIYIAVAGGTADAVATAILSKKGAGAPMTGDTPVTVYDDNPLYVAPIPYVIKFQRPEALQILLRVVIASGPDVPSDAETQIQNALIAAFAGDDDGPRARIGSVLYATRYIPPIAALGAWAQVALIAIGSKNVPGAVVLGHIDGNTLTVPAGGVVSGALAVGQAIFGNLIANGTYITVFGTGGGGDGTYTVNNPQTVSGATFTGTGSGTNLTASAVTGLIGIGDTITGTGAPANTTIVSQTSGTTGGAGVYVTSNATTSSAAALAANETITAAAADQTLVSVQIDQIPQLTASNIAVNTT